MKITQLMDKFVNYGFVLIFIFAVINIFITSDFFLSIFMALSITYALITIVFAITWKMFR